MTQGSDGALYGLASENGAGGFGALFRLDPATSAFSIVHDFDGAGGKTPIAGLLPMADFLYGTTNEGGANSQGTLFRIDTAGVFENLWDFTGTEGAAPRNALIAGSDGLLYGGAYGGGATGDGSLFHYDSGAGVVSFHDFQPSEGRHAGPLVEISDGVFDGTTTAGGAHAAGTLYQSDAAGTVSVLHDFGSDQDDGTHPSGRIVLATDGRVYGTTEQGASPDLGSIYRFDGTTFEIVQIFEPESGVYPFGGLMQAADGSLYGTTFSGGLSDRGVIYRLFPEAAIPSVTAIVPSSGAGQGGTSVAVQGTHFHPAAGLSIGGIAALRVDEDSRSLLGVAPALTPGALYDVTVLNPSTMTTLEKGWFADFLDVDSSNIFHDDVEAIVRAGITAGCGGGNYCVAAAVTRAQMAVFLLKAKLGAGLRPAARHRHRLRRRAARLLRRRLDRGARFARASRAAAAAATTVRAFPVTRAPDGHLPAQDVARRRLRAPVVDRHDLRRRRPPAPSPPTGSTTSTAAASPAAAAPIRCSTARAIRARSRWTSMAKSF